MSSAVAKRKRRVAVVELVRNRQALVLATVAASLWALALVLAGVAAVTLSPSGLGTYDNLFTAAAWLDFAAALAVLAATSFVGWAAVVRQQFGLVWEQGGLTLATLVFAIGLLVQAVSAPNASDAGFVVSAIGLGGWAVVIVVNAGRRSIQEQQTPGFGRQARFMLGAAAAVAVVAVALGLPSPSITDSTLAVAGDVLYAAGFAGLALVLVGARGRRMVDPRQFPVFATGLWILAIASLVEAVLDGIVYGPPPISVSSLRTLSVGPFIEVIGFGVLAWSAFNRIGELSSGTASAPRVAIDPEQGDTLQADTLQADTLQAGDSPPATLVPPSWHADPAGRHEFRWWDGRQWTEHVTDAGQPSTDPPE